MRSQYHQASEKAKNNIEISKNTKAADVFFGKRTQDFWLEIRKLKDKTNLSPSMIDNCHDKKDISEIFALKYNKLLNSVSSPEPEMVALNNGIKTSIKKRCCPQSADREVTCRYKHTIDVNDVAQAVTHIKGGGPRVVVSTATFHARVRGSVPGLGGLKETTRGPGP